MADYPGWPADMLGRMFDRMVDDVCRGDAAKLERALRVVGDIAKHIPEDDPNRGTLIEIAVKVNEIANSREWMASGLRRLADACEKAANERSEADSRLLAYLSKRNAERREENNDER